MIANENIPPEFVAAYKEYRLARMRPQRTAEDIRRLPETYQHISDLALTLPQLPSEVSTLVPAHIFSPHEFFPKRTVLLYPIHEDRSPSDLNYSIRFASNLFERMFGVRLSAEGLLDPLTKACWAVKLCGYLPSHLTYIWAQRRLIHILNPVHQHNENLLPRNDFIRIVGYSFPDAETAMRLGVHLTPREIEITRFQGTPL